MKRPYIEVEVDEGDQCGIVGNVPSCTSGADATESDTPGFNAASNIDPIDKFLFKIHSTNKTTPAIRETNRRLLKNLIDNNYIAKSSIIWKNGQISRIYGLKIDKGCIMYERVQHSQESPIKVGIPATSIDLSSLKNAVIKENSNKTSLRFPTYGGLISPTELREGSYHDLPPALPLTPNISPMRVHTN